MNKQQKEFLKFIGLLLCIYCTVAILLNALIKPNLLNGLFAIVWILSLIIIIYIRLGKQK